MNSIYHKIHEYISSCYDFPLQKINILENNIQEVTQSLTNKAKTELLVEVKTHMQKLHDFSLTNGNLYFADKEFIEQNFEAVHQHIASFKDSFIKNQIKERFYSQKGDKILVKFVKKIKLTTQQIIWIKPKLYNLYRKIRKKAQKSIDYKKHKVKQKKLAQLVYENVFLDKFDKLYHQNLLNRQLILLQIDKLNNNFLDNIIKDEQINTNEIFDEIQTIKSSINENKALLDENISKIAENLTKEFTNLQLKCGTFEFPLYKLESNRLAFYKKKYLKKIIKTHNSHKYLYEINSSYNQLLFDTKSKILEQSINFNNCNEQIETNFKNITEKQFINIINKLKTWLHDNKTKNKHNIEVLENEILNTLIPKFVNSMMKFDIKDIIGQLETKSYKLFTGFNTNIKTTRNGEFNKLIKNRNVRKLNAKVIITLRYNKLIKSEFDKEKHELVKNTQTILQKVNEITKIIEYSISFLEIEKKTEEIIHEFDEGIKRAVIKSNEVLEEIENFKKGLHKKINDINKNFNKELIDALNIKTLLSKVQQNERKNKINLIRESINLNKSKTQELYSKFKKETKNTYSLSKKQYTKLQERFGIAKSQEDISKELSYFLSATKNRVKELPFMYQKLFNSEPLIDSRYYIDRTKTGEELNTALKFWEKNNFAATCLAGEIGSGVTTTINFFVQKLKQHHKIIRHSINSRITNETDFDNFLKIIFADIRYTDKKTLKHKIKRFKTPTIIIVENIHKLFIRHHNGFKNIIEFLRIVASSNNNIFWICSSDLYAWKYLQKAVNINTYFAFNIELESFTKEELSSILQKRHLPSGYTKNFIAPTNIAISRKYKKLNEEEKQIFLQNAFFDNIYKTTQGNIKVALLYWQTSIMKVKEHTFDFTIQKMDTSFLESMSLKNQIILHNILIHGGITAKEFRRIFKQNESIDALKILENDTIITKQKNEYHINTLLYRQIVDHLKATNLIY